MSNRDPSGTEAAGPAVKSEHLHTAPVNRDPLGREPLGQEQPDTRATPVLRGSGLSYAVSPTTTLLEGVDVTVHAGGITGVLGPNGAGKSTLLRLIVGAISARAGTVRLGTTEATQADVATMSRRERARKVAFVAQDSPAEVSMEVLDVVLLGRTPHLGAFAPDSTKDVELAMASLQRAGAAHLAGRDIATLSGGERQRVHLARALTQEPSVLVLDEPTNHLDVAAQLQVLDLIGQVAAGGTGVLVAMHDLDQAARLCDEVVVLDGGRTASAGPPGQVLTRELIGAVWGVEAEWVPTSGGRTLILSRLAPPSQ